MIATAATAPADPELFRREFVEFAIRSGVLKFGEFKTKAGRLSPYFFNAGMFSDGERLGALGRYYARAALASGIGFDVLFGPAYKGITLASAAAVALAALGHNVPFCYNRKRPRTTARAAASSEVPCRGGRSSWTT
jgi:orotate phosphoribosyltransferase